MREWMTGQTLKNCKICCQHSTQSATSLLFQHVEQVHSKHLYWITDHLTHTQHTIILLLFWNLSGTTQVSRYQKGKNQEGKTNLDLLEQEIVSGSGICWAIWSLRLIPDNHTNITPLSFFTDRMPFLLPNQQRQSTASTVNLWTTVGSLKLYYASLYGLIIFSALTLLAGWQEGHPTCKKSDQWGAGVVICQQPLNRWLLLLFCYIVYCFIGTA